MSNEKPLSGILHKDSIIVSMIQLDSGIILIATKYDIYSTNSTGELKLVRFVDRTKDGPNG